jgi:hypothetical protein
MAPCRHCERSEAIWNLSVAAVWIPSSLSLLAMTEEKAERPYPTAPDDRSFLIAASS